MTPEQWENAAKILAPKELEAVKRLGSGVNSLSPATAAQLFSLFCQGYSIDSLVRQNPNYGSLALGLISKARIEYGWDVERERYIKNLMECTRVAAEKAALESMQFAMDGMAVYHRMMGNKFRAYLQSGKEEDLGEDWSKMSLATYLKFVTLYQSMSGKDVSSKANSVSVPVQVEVSAVAAPTPETLDKPMTANQAEALLAQMLGTKN